VEVSLSKLFSVRSGRGSLITDILGIVPNAFGEGCIKDCRLGGGFDWLLLLLLLLVQAFLLVGAFDLCLSRDGLVSFLVIGDIECLEGITHVQISTIMI
jgi:hypothetical protein